MIVQYVDAQQSLATPRAQFLPLLARAQQKSARAVDQRLPRS